MKWGEKNHFWIWKLSDWAYTTFWLKAFDACNHHSKCMKIQISRLFWSLSSLILLTAFLPEFCRGQNKPKICFPPPVLKSSLVRIFPSWHLHIMAFWTSSTYFWQIHLVEVAGYFQLPWTNSWFRAGMVVTLDLNREFVPSTFVTLYIIVNYSGLALTVFYERHFEGVTKVYRVERRLHKEPKKARCQNGTCAQKLQNFILVKAEGSIFFIWGLLRAVEVRKMKNENQKLTIRGPRTWVPNVNWNGMNWGGKSVPISTFIAGKNSLISSNLI